MHKRIASWFARGALLSLGACFLVNTTADKRISEAVQNLNDQARWGRVTDAALMVQPDYRDKFLDQRRLWGSEIQLADAEVLNVQLASDSESANAMVSYSWYSMKDMTLHVTTLKQHWKSVRTSFALASEIVVRGDPALLSPPAQ